MRAATLAGALLVAAACSASGGEKSDGNTRLVDAHTALCEAAARPDQARALFFDRSHDALHEVARMLEDADRAQAARLLEAKQTVESELEASGRSQPEDVLRLADTYRTSLGRLAITVAPCNK
ncbi:MAG: hypothetical protein M3203_13610 [Actinomycetota bacterium]|nr:hypothetical protein [Actinomycetota bacterium]